MADVGNLAASWPLRRRALLVRGFCCSRIKTASVIPFLEQDTETLTDHDLATPPAHSQFPADYRNSRFGWEQVDAGLFHHFGDGGTRGHTDPAPSRPVNRDAARGWPRSAQARCYFAQQIVGGAVIRLTGIPEAAGNRAECHRCA